MIWGRGSKKGNNKFVQMLENAPWEWLWTVFEEVPTCWLLTTSTYHAAAGHTLFLSLHSLEFSMPDQFR